MHEAVAAEDEIRARQRVARQIAAVELPSVRAVLRAVRGDELFDDVDADVGGQVLGLEIPHPVEIAARCVEDRGDAEAVEERGQMPAELRTPRARRALSRARLTAAPLVVMVDEGK